MRALAASSEPGAREAIELFAYRLCGEIGRLAAALGGLDGLVFTAGIGKHDADLRAEVCRRLAWLGIVPDLAANARSFGNDGVLRIGGGDSAVAVWVIATDEEAMTAQHTQAVLAG